MDEDPSEEFLASALFSIQCNYHQTHNYLPPQIMFGRDMFIPIDAEINWEQILYVWMPMGTF